jgi:hypothetical protein
VTFSKEGEMNVDWKRKGWTALAVWMLAGAALAETSFTARLKEGMAQLKSRTAKLGVPKADGLGLFFGSTRVNGNYEVVDAVKAQVGCTATLFVKKGSDFIRVSTNVIKDDGSRAVGTPLDPKGKAYAAIVKGEAFYGVVDILGHPYDTGYEPIRDASGATVGVYYVGFPLK